MGPPQPPAPPRSQQLCVEKGLMVRDRESHEIPLHLLAAEFRTPPTQGCRITIFSCSQQGGLARPHLRPQLESPGGPLPSVLGPWARRTAGLGTAGSVDWSGYTQPPRPVLPQSGGGRTRGSYGALSDACQKSHSITSALLHWSKQPTQLQGQETWTLPHNRKNVGELAAISSKAPQPCGTFSWTVTL